MKKRLLAILLAGMFMVPQNSVFAEELTDGEEHTVEEYGAEDTLTVDESYSDDQVITTTESPTDKNTCNREEIEPSEDDDTLLDSSEIAEELFDGELEENLDQAGVSSGTCGANLTWTLDNGVLTISGTGPMRNLQASTFAPWYSERSSIRQVIIGTKVTSIGDHAFDRCTNLTSITIPNSVTSIGDYAVQNCTSLTSVTIPNSVTIIGRYAFYNCTNLTSIIIQNGVTSIGYNTFSRCTSLKSVTIPNSVESIKAWAFERCSSLSSIYFIGNAPSIGTAAFDRVTATVYYPADNSTWTSSVRQDYSGNITWKPWNPNGSSQNTSLNAPSITGYYNSVRGADIRWNKVANATGYYIYRNRAADGGNKLVGTANGGSVTQLYDGGVKDNCWGQVYSYTVVAYNGSAKSAASTAVILQRLAPMKFTTCNSPYAGKGCLKWACTTSGNKALGYELQYAKSRSDLYDQRGSFNKLSLRGRNNVSATIEGLSAGTTYYFRVRAYVNYTHSVTGKTTKTWSQYSDVVSVKITK